MGMLLRRHRQEVVVEPVHEEPAPSLVIADTEFQYTKEEVKKMPFMKLKKVAKENGISDELSATEMKEQLIEKFRL